MTVFWDVAPCSLVNTDPRFRRGYSLHHRDVLMMETSVSVYIHQTTWRSMPEDSHLHARRSEHLEYHRDKTSANIKSLDFYGYLRIYRLVQEVGVVLLGCNALLTCFGETS
jgi:hypothetical protein